MEGSSNIELKIQLSDIKNSILHTTYYIGESRKTDENAQEVAAALQASDSNDDIISVHRKAAIAKVQNMLTKYLGKTDAKVSGYTFAVSTPIIEGEPITYKYTLTYTYDDGRPTKTEIITTKHSYDYPTTIAGTSTHYDEYLSFKVYAPKNYGETQNRTISGIVLKYISYYIIREWLSAIKPDEATIPNNAMISFEQELRMAAAHRDKPTL